MDQKQLMEAAEQIDFTAVIARLAGGSLSEEQEKMCRQFDALYDAVHGLTPEGICGQ